MKIVNELNIQLTTIKNLFCFVRNQKADDANQRGCGR